MELITIITIAAGLAADAFAVAIVAGSTYKKLNIVHAFRMAAFFGLFQALMPLVGSLAGLTMKDFITPYDHWVAFILLVAVGGKMIYESFKIKKKNNNFDPSSIIVVFVLSVATSIDALAVGITLSFIVTYVVVAVIIIGLVTFTLSYLGVFIGKQFKHFFESKIEIIGAVILIAIGTKILFQHIFF